MWRIPGTITNPHSLLESFQLVNNDEDSRRIARLPVAGRQGQLVDLVRQQLSGNISEGGRRILLE